MLFLAPWLVLGTLLGALPVVIHLLNKPRYHREQWGAMRFLQAAITSRSRTIKMQHWLLMALRTLAIIFFALALSRPVMRAFNIGAGSQPTTHVLIFDGSYTMRQGEHRDQAFEKARSAALEIIENMQEQDNALLVWAGNQPRALTPRPVFNQAELRRTVEQLKPGWEKADMSRAVEYAAWLLNASTLPRHRIVVLSDGRKQTWPMDDPDRWNAAGEAIENHNLPLPAYGLLQSPEADIRNMTLNKLYTRFALLDVHRDAFFVAEVDNHIGREQQIELIFSVNGEETERRPVTIQPGKHSETFNHRFEEAGSHYVTVKLLDDDLPVDNTRDLAVEVLQSIPVLLVEGSNTGNPLTSDGMLLQWALEAGASEEHGSLFAVETMPEVDLDRLTARDLLQYKSILLANVRSLPSETSRMFDRYVREGGGMLVGLGSRTSPAAWNRLERGREGLLPGTIMGIRHAEGRAWRPVFPAGLAADSLDLFDVARTRTLGDVRIDTHLEVLPVEDALTAGVVDEHPLLLLRPHELGKVAMWTSSLGLEWNNLAATPDYVPLMQNLVFHLSSSVVPPINLRQGESLVYSWSRAAALAEKDPDESAPRPRPPQSCILITPDGEEHQLELSSRLGENIAYWGETLMPGIYRVKADGVPDRIYAVTLPSDVGNLASIEIAGESIEPAGVPVQLTASMHNLDTMIRRETGVRDLGTFLALLALILLVAEMILGWRASE